MRLFVLVLSNTLRGFQRQRRLPQLEILFSASMPGLGQFPPPLCVERGVPGSANKNERR
jgi:hypothetical protein